MNIIKKNIKDLNPAVYNPRKDLQPGDVEYEHIKNSIEKFGYIDPIIYNKKNNVIIGGHQRFKVLKELGYKEIDCVEVDLEEKEEKALNIALNKIGGEWDMEAIQVLLSELDKELIDDLGLSFDDLEEIEKELELEDKEIIEDEVPDVDETSEPTAKRGQIWKLGNHRLMCGDSTNKDDVERLMNGNKADLLFTDPPYNVSIENKSKEILKSENYSHIENDSLNEEDFKNFLDRVFKNANMILKDDASYYVFTCQGGDNEMMMMMMRENGIKCRHQIIWVKDAPVFSMGRLDYDYKHEPILYGWKKKHNFYRNGEQDKSVWEFKRTANKLHPTMKPVELIVNALMNSTKKDDLVIDLFGGSGSTLIACEQVNRICYMMEYDQHYVDVIIKRWENLTGQKAELIEDGVEDGQIKE